MMCKAVTAAIAVLLVCSSVVQAQRPGRFRGRDGQRGAVELTFMLRVPEVKQELELTAEQQQLLDALLEDLQDQRRAAWGAPGGPPGTRSGSEQAAPPAQSVAQHGEDLIEAVLEPTQAVRLRQLRLQQQGAAALVRPEIVQALSLDDSQLGTIRQMLAAEAAIEPSQFAPAARQQRAADQSLDAQVSTVLSDQQKQIWENMKGKPFRFPDWSQRFSRRGPFGRRGLRGGE